MGRRRRGSRRRAPLGALAVIVLFAGGVGAHTAGEPAPQRTAGDWAGGPAAGAPASMLVPVLLVPGWSDGAGELGPLRERFLAAGWDSAAVRVVDFRDPVGSNREHARELAREVAALQAATGAAMVDVVAHSMGGLALRYHLSRQDPGSVEVRRVAFLATPHHGTWSALVAWGEGGSEMVPGSDFLLELMRGAALPAGVQAITVRTPVDLHVLPQESARLATVPDVELCCPTHAGLLADPRTFIVVEAFLVRGDVLRPEALFDFGRGFSSAPAIRRDSPLLRNDS